MADDDLKAALKEALKEWLDEKYASFGKYSLAALGAGLLAAAVFFILSAQGWHRNVY